MFNQKPKDYNPEKLAKLQGKKFGSLDYFATGEGRLVIYYCSIEDDDDKFTKDFQNEMKVNDYFMICMEICEHHELLNTFPEWFLEANENRTSGFGAFQTYQNLS